ncbi:ArsR/SmtB family transcription factor [Streptomyces iconiensis]|uniref:Winged helix-turn-helix domain-containing protein n=1 Tax=Streptomyces iconiensis TaxID=1384038 RepID=A0ABT7A6E0_9ACTN|nr:winged helix-turn-helix domain-containing protein [Streptomyces iconiensis]MDJ1136909.1 winged helix-turn-helix domain-containing protein [Streptomyces iconiensis]
MGDRTQYIGGLMLRVHFTGGDLARTRVADGPDPFWESVLSLHRLRETRLEPALSGWREHVARTDVSPLRQLLPLVPPRGYFPDFLTPAESARGFETGLDALLSTPRAQLRCEIGALAATAPLTPEARDIAQGSAAALELLGGALRAYQHSALVPWWQRITARIESDRTWRTRTQWYDGTEAMLRGFGPAMRWCPPVLEADYPVDKDLYLEGRGLLLIPSFFCRRAPVALADPALPPTLVYRANAGVRRQELPTLTAATGRHLARLLGHTRAAVLQALGGECTTSELARRAGVSLSSASEHASVLRDAGLISSSRRRNAVHHSLTPVGLALLDESPTPVPL